MRGGESRDNNDSTPKDRREVERLKTARDFLYALSDALTA